MAAIHNRVPYLISVEAQDVKSLKKVVNVFFTRNGVQTGAPIAYGANIAGSSSLLTLVTNFSTAWKTTAVPYLSINYSMLTVKGNEIVGKQYQTIKRAISAVSIATGFNVLVTAASAHGLQTGDSVAIAGVTAPSALNAVWEVINYNTNSFQLKGSTGITGTWSNDGTWQKAAGAFGWRYGDTSEFAGDAGTLGSITGEALPLFTAASIRRKTASATRHFRGHTSFSPLGESQALNGKLTTTAKTNIDTAFQSYISSPIANGGSDAGGSGAQLFCNGSKGLAAMAADPFTESETWCKDVLLMFAQPNLGSVLSRKPRLTSPIG